MTIFWIFGVLSAIGLFSYVLQVWAVLRRTAPLPPSDGEGRAGLPLSFYPPVSILKPLKGVDDRLFDNLESFCRLDYPEYEIIFALQDMNDPARKVAALIKEKYPEKDITLLVRRCGEGLNPKVSNLMPAFAASKYEHVLISDSNVSVCRDYLKETVKHMADPHVGLVTNPIRGVGGRTMGSVLENLHLNSFVIGSVCFLDSFLKMPCVIGKSMLMRKSDLEAIGGLRSVKDVLAEDYIIGREMHRSGKRVVLADHVIHNVNEYWGTRKFLNRHTRWGKLRWKIGGARYLAELVANPVFLSLMPLVLLGPASDTLTLALLVGLLKIVGDCHVGKKIGSKMNPLCYLLVPVKDALIGLLWLAPLVSNTIVWRGNRYLIEKDSRLQPYPDDSIWGIRFRVLDAIKARFA